MARNLGDAGRVYRCTWEQTARGYRVCSKGRAAFCGEGKSFDEARDALMDAIMAATGDGEAYLDIESLPTSAVIRPFFKKAAYWVWGEADSELTNVPDLYDGGLCPRGGHPAGARNRRKAVVRSVQKGAAGAIAHMIGSIFSQIFLDALPPSVPKSLFRPVAGPKDRERFFELDISKAQEPAVLRLSLGSPGTECKRCGFRTLYYAIGDIVWFIPEAALARPYVIVGTAGRSGELVLRADVWAKVKRKRLSRICSREVPVVPSSLVISHPRLPKE